MATYHAGTAAIDLIPSLKGFHKTAAQELRAINPTVTVSAVADTKQVQRQLLAATRTKLNPIQLKIEASTKELAKAEAAVVAAEKRMTAAKDSSSDAAERLKIAEQQLAETRARGNAKASQISAGELRVAQAKRAAAAAANDATNAEAALNQARRSASDAKTKLQTDVDTDGLGAKLQAFAVRAGQRYRVKLGVDPELTGAQAQLAVFRATAAKLASIHGRVELDTGAALAKLSAVSAAGAAIGTGVAAGVGVAGAALVALPAVIATVLGPIGALTAGIAGVPTAFQAFSQAEDQAAQNATSNAKAQRAAAQQITSAQQQVGQAHVQLSRAYEDAATGQATAARRIQDAERQVIDAEQAHLRARQALTRAVEDARRAQRDLAFEVEGGALAERQAVLDLKEAQDALEAARAGDASGPALERAQLAYEQQALSLQEIQARNADLTQEKAASDAAGIAGSDQVVAAQDRVAEASRSVADAQQGVRDAQTAAAQQQIQTQRSIADAQLQVANAQQALTNAMLDAGSVGASATDKINAAMAKLSPSAKAFVTDLRALSPEFDNLKTTAQEALFAGLGPAFTDFGKTVLPQMATNLGVVNTAVNGVTKDMLGFLATQETAGQFQQLFAGIGQVITAVGPVLQVFVRLFLELANAAMPGIVALVQAIGTIGTALLTALQPLIDSGVITQAVTLLAQLLVSLAPILAELVAMAVQLWVAIGPTLISTVQALTPVISSLLALFVQVAPILAQIVLAIAQALLPVVQALAPVIAQLLPPIATLISAGLAILVPLIEVAAQVFLALMPAIQAIAGVVAALVPVIAPLIAQLAAGLIPLAQALAPLITQLATILLQGLAAAMTTLIPFVLQVVQALMPMIPILMSIITQIVTGLLPILVPLMDAFLQLVLAVLPILPPLLQLADALLPTLIAVVGALATPLTVLAQIFTGVLAAVINSIVLPALSALTTAFKIIGDGLSFLYNGIIRPTWYAVGAVIDAVWTKTIKPAFDFLADGTRMVADVFQKMGDAISGIWGGLKKLVHGGIQGLVDIVWNYGIRKFANAVIEYIPGLDYLPEIKIPEFARGGMLPGYAPGRDSILSLLSPGEAVLVPELARVLGEDTINAANAAAMRGRGYSRGGIVGGLARFADGGVVTAAGAASGSTAAAVTIDPAALAGLGETAAAVTELIASLAAALSVVLGPAVVALSTTVATTGANALAGYGQQTTATAGVAVAQWSLITGVVDRSVSAQGVALTALQNALSATRAAIGATADWAVAQFDRIRAAAADPIRWVLQWPVNAGLIAAWNALDAQFAFNRHVNPVPIGFAFGGRVHGPGTPTSDSIDARLSVGEFVVRQAIARRIYPFLAALNGGDAEALQAAGYAGGGIVANTGSQLNAALLRGLTFAKDQDGKPYIWGGVGPDGFDCSGFMSAITNVLRGETNPYQRLGVAASQPWPGFVPGLSSAFATGFSDVHTAGTLAGINVESGGSPSLVKFGTGAAGADDRQFAGHASLPLVGGTFRTGGGGIDIAGLIGPAFADTYRLLGQVATMFAGNLMTAQAGGVGTAASDGVRAAATSALTSLLSVTAARAGSPEVTAAVRGVAARYGWDTGPQWDALSWIISRESGWNPNAANPTSSARGLFQKMTSVHGPLESTVAGQAEWGLNYIRARYGDPLGARAWWQSHNWYDDGGVARGVGWMFKGTPEPERVLSPAQTRGFDTLVAAVGAGRYSTAAGGGTNSGVGQFTGALYLDSGEFLGMVDGRIEQANDEVAGDITRGTR